MRRTSETLWVVREAGDLECPNDAIYPKKTEGLRMVPNVAPRWPLVQGRTEVDWKRKVAL